MSGRSASNKMCGSPRHQLGLGRRVTGRLVPVLLRPCGDSGAAGAAPRAGDGDDDAPDDAAAGDAAPPREGWTARGAAFVAAGANHSVCVDRAGRVFSWGHAEYCQARASSGRKDTRAEGCSSLLFSRFARPQVTDERPGSTAPAPAAHMAISQRRSTTTCRAASRTTGCRRPTTTTAAASAAAATRAMRRPTRRRRSRTSGGLSRSGDDERCSEVPCLSMEEEKYFWFRVRRRGRRMRDAAMSSPSSSSSSSSSSGSDRSAVVAPNERSVGPTTIVIVAARRHCRDVGCWTGRVRLKLHARKDARR